MPISIIFFFNDTATTEIYTLSLHDALPIPASEAYADGNVLQITPASTNPLFTERKLWNVARVCGRDDQQGLVAAQYIAKNYKGKNVAILNDKTTYGKGLADETKKAL